MLHHLPALLFIAAQARPSSLHWLSHRKCDSLSLQIAEGVLSGCGDCAFGDELVEILVELSLVFETESDVFASRLDLIDRQDLPPPQQSLYSLCFGMRGRRLVLGRLQKT